MANCLNRVLEGMWLRRPLTTDVPFVGARATPWAAIAGVLVSTLQLIFATMPGLLLTHVDSTTRLEHERRSDRREMLTAIQDSHAQYSISMTAIYEYARKVAATGASEKGRSLEQVYSSEYHDRHILDEHQRKEVVEVNRSRSMAKDYYKRIRSFCAEFGCPENDPIVTEWRDSHEHFCEVVKPLESAVYREDRSKDPIFSWNHVVRSSLA